VEHPSGGACEAALKGCATTEDSVTDMTWRAGCLLTLAALALGQALQVKNGFLHDRALAWLLAAAALLVGALFASKRVTPLDRRARELLAPLLLGGVLFQVAQQLWARPLLYAPQVRHGWSDPTLALTLASIAVLAVLVAAGGTRVRAIAFSGIVAALLVAGAWAIRTVPSPRIDVVTVSEAAIEAVRAGRSPYSISFRNIYGETRFYGEGMATESDVRQGFPYPPLTLALLAPGEWLLGDYRYALVAATAAAVVLIGSIGWTRHAMLAGTLLATTPRILFEIEQGWTEPIVVFLLALSAASLARRRTGSIALGLTLAVKQYILVALLLAPLFPASVPALARRRLVRALVVAMVLTVPFVVWDPSGFLNSVVLLQLREPFRRDSLSVIAWLAHHGIAVPAMVATIAAGAVALVLALRTLPRSVAGFAAGLALVTCAMFLFGKKAFCNYYFFVLGALCVAIAAIGAEEGS
jgi:hypothetical protein